MSQPRWNGEPCEARRVRVIVADAPEFPQYWARRFVGQERAAVEVLYGGQTFYIDDEGYEHSDEEMAALAPLYDVGPQLLDAYKRLGREPPKPERVHGFPGWGWAKVMAGGGPGHGSASLVIERVVGEVGE